VFNFLIFKNALIYVETYLITSFIINKNFTLKRVIIFYNIFKKSFLEKITKVSIINFNNKLTNLRQQKKLNFDILLLESNIYNTTYKKKSIFYYCVFYFEVDNT